MNVQVFHDNQLIPIHVVLRGLEVEITPLSANL